MPQKSIVILASGNGSNAENIARYFSSSPLARVEAVITNNTCAGVIERAKKLGVACVAFNKYAGQKKGFLLKQLLIFKPDLIVLAGYLAIIPHEVVQAFPHKIINIHPALLPKFGGKGMYGDHVHRAVLASGETQSGITIHYVNEEYDKGEIIFQSALSVQPGETAETLAKRIHQYEYKHYPPVIAQILAAS